MKQNAWMASIIHRKPRNHRSGEIRQFILFHGERHPIEMGETEFGEFRQHLALNKRVAASTQNQALNALLFLYGSVLNQPLENCQTFCERSGQCQKGSDPLAFKGST